MGDSNLTKLTASLEELSLRKQLPLRQTAQKPILKYNHPIAKPVQLANHQSEYIAIRQDGRNAYSSLSQASVNSTMAPSAPYRLSRNPNPSGTDGTTTPLGSYLGGQTYIAPNNVGKPSTPNTSKGHSNPYARPLSAKDIVNDLQNQTRVVKKSSSSSQVTPGITGLTRNETPVSFVPVNSFMRPQSAVRKDSASSNRNKDTGNGREHSATSAPKVVAVKGENGTIVTSDSVPKDKPSSNPVQNTTKPVVTTTTSTSSGHNGQTSTTTITTTKSGATVVQKVSAPANFGTQISSIISKVTESKPSSSSLQGSSSKATTKPVSSIPKPGFSSASSQSGSTSEATSSGSTSQSGSKSSTPDLQAMAKVRNLNYTPTKPYNEVMEPPTDSPAPTPPLGTKTEKPSATSASKPSRPMQTTVTATSSPEETQKRDAKTISSKMAQLTQSATSTVYYSKGSKSEVILHEQRPAVVGAPSKRVMSEKSGSGGSMVGDEEGTEESDFGSPGERLPGDGEASLEEFGDDDDDGIDCLEDDYVGGSDGESDGYSITSSISRQSSAARSRARSARRSAARSASSTSEDSRPRTAKASASAVTTIEQEKVLHPPLRRSLFPNIPPTINFVVEGEKVEQLPWEYRKLLKWRMSPITPNIVKHTLARVGFRITKRNHDWLGCWGKHMKSQGFKAIREYQKLNHFPGSFQIGRKDRLWRNLSKMQLHCGKKEYGFFPQTFVLPYDNKLLKRAWEDGGNKQKWIIKPPASARGIGIKVISKWNQIPRKRAVIVQRYLGRPYLINDSKFDMRIYVYVSSYDPLRVYVFEDGLARFASCKYSSSMKNLNNKFMHLTNYSINKKNDDYQANGDEKLCQGHKWGLKALWNYMKRQGVNTAAIWESIKDLVIKTIVCADSPINSMIKANVRSRYCIHELFGFDILLDENLKPWILEVNISPSLHSNSQLDINIKGQMIRDLFNIAGYRIPEKHDVVVHNNQMTTTADFSNHNPSNDYCMDKRLFAQNHSPDERSKHAYYSQRHQDEQVLQTILDVLTPDDIRILTESIDEDSRKGCFQRVFPTPSTHKYMHFFETQRYYNLLLDQYVQRYNRMEQKGISLLELYCDEGVHLENPTDNPYHQWAPPTSGLNSFRGEPRMQSAPQPKHDIRAAMHVRSSVSTSQLPKVSKKPPKAPAVAIHSHRTGSQSSSASSMTSPGETTPVKNYANVASLSATKSR